MATDAWRIFALEFALYLSKQKLAKEKPNINHVSLVCTDTYCAAFKYFLLGCNHWNTSETSRGAISVSANLTALTPHLPKLALLWMQRWAKSIF